MKVDNKPHKIFSMTFAYVYPFYIAKVERKGKTKQEVHEIITWLTGYSENEIAAILKSEITFEAFFKDAPKLNPNTSLIKGVICGHRVEDIEDPLIQKIRYLDKLIDELAKGKAMEKILRK